MIIFRTIISFLKNRDYRNLLFATAAMLIIGTVTYHYVEQWTWLDSFYFSITTLTTVGYGDFSPRTEWGKIFTIIYIIIGVGLILTFINTVYIHFKNMPKDNFNNKK